MHLDTTDLDGGELYRTLSSAVVPRPIGWISSVSSDGDANLAPFSFFTLACPDPPIVVFSASEREVRRKDTPINVLATEEFVVNLVTEDLAEAMKRTSEPLDEDEDEFEYAGLESRDSETVSVPQVALAEIALECTFRDTKEVGTNLMIFGDVEHIRIDDQLLTGEKLDVRNVDAVGRLAGPYYTTLDVFEIE